jgi:hypothetical protein
MVSCMKLQLHWLHLQLNLLSHIFAMDSKCAHHISKSFDLFTNQVPNAIWDGPTKEAQP